MLLLQDFMLSEVNSAMNIPAITDAIAPPIIRIVE